MKIHLVFLLVGIFSTTAHADCAQRLADTTIHLYPARTVIEDQTSRPLIAWMILHLKRYRHLAETGTSTVAAIYKAITPDLSELITSGEALERSPTLNQDQVFNMAHAFVSVVDFAADFANRVGYYADGFNLMLKFNTPEYQERAREFEERFGVDPFITNVPATLARQQTRRWRRPKKDLNFTRYLISGLYKEAPNKQHYFFQYKYVPVNYELSMRALFETRERGIAYYGVSQKPSLKADGQNLDARLFQDHDLFHAFTMKYQDLKLFRQLGVTTIEAAREVKAINNTLLQGRLREWESLKSNNRALNCALETLFFAILHEQARTYPQGTLEDLTTRADFYLTAIKQALQNGRLGQRAKTILKDQEYENLIPAIQWLKQRAQTDAETFKTLHTRRLMKPAG